MTTTNFKTDALGDPELRAIAPSIFATGPMSGLSSRYTFVPTTQIVAGLRHKGWLPVSVEQQRPRSPARFGFQKHLVRFRRAEQMDKLDEWNTELVLTNSHDAACAYVLRLGIYRRLCSNGLVVSDAGFEAIRFRHARLQMHEVVQASYRILEYAPKVGAMINRFRECCLDPYQALEFAQRALLLRFETPDRSPIEAPTLLNVRRPEDEPNDLWTVLNRVQENLVRGGLTDHKCDRRGRRRSLRPLRGIDSKVCLNRSLWDLATATATRMS